MDPADPIAATYQRIFPGLFKGTTGSSGAGSAAKQAQDALERYNRAMEQLRSGDWAGFGKEIDAMRGILEEMSRPSGGR
jgi:hypothetical protein